MDKKLKMLYFRWLILSLIFIIFGGAGLIIFVKYNSYVIPPSIYIMSIIIGSGWLATLIAAIRD